MSAPAPSPSASDDPLNRFLRAWLGAVPPLDGGVVVVGDRQREEPGWDGAVRPVAGVETIDGAVVSVPPDAAEAVRTRAEELDGDLDRLGDELAELLDRPGWRFGRGIFRWTLSPTEGPDLGRWVPTDHPGLPEWLRPFNGDVLVAEIDGRVAAGVGRKIHNPHGHELAVVTEEAFRGRGLAARLVCQAARRVLADGAVPLYFHAHDNHASARTAEACGFGDEGRLVLGLFPGAPG